MLIAGTVYRDSCQGRQAMNLQTLAAFSPSEGGHGLADEERVNGVLIAGTVYRNSCESADSWPLDDLAEVSSHFVVWDQ